jgi:hypothetical protein
MRRAPLNYLITIALGCVLWAVTGFVVGNYLGDSVVLQVLTTDDFLMIYRLALMAASALGIASCLYWYFYGSRKSTAGRLPEARRFWLISFVLLCTVAAAELVTLVVMFRAEALTVGNFAIVFLMLSLQTFVFFWLCTFLMSPRAVEYVPWGKR